ncbi:MAG: hypothetical protein O3A56_05660 [Proteobacteria bacterium]|nr:hypothetical protein [Pseudomonadota bacterium]MDA0862745.1 hypothetical protein [Pseudomonadota bacterium]MDA1030924.1 hypothetical protein [Pseudomonadota bacterium]
MRYIFLLLMLISSSAHAEWDEYGDNIYSKDIELNPLTQRVSVQLLIDLAPGSNSHVYHMQYQCENGVPTKQRTFWSAFYEGNMGSGEADYKSTGADWIPIVDSRFTYMVVNLCNDVYKLRPERNPLY